MKGINRREFLAGSIAAGTGLGSLLLAKDTEANTAPGTVKDDISIAQWALVQEIREGKWKTLDFPRIAREDFDINGIEFVSTLFELPTYSYLQRLRRNAEKYDVRMILLMNISGKTIVLYP